MNALDNETISALIRIICVSEDLLNVSITQNTEKIVLQKDRACQIMILNER